MIALGGPKLKRFWSVSTSGTFSVSMIALGGPKLKRPELLDRRLTLIVSMIALGGPKLKLLKLSVVSAFLTSFNDSTGWA